MKTTNDFKRWSVERYNSLVRFLNEGESFRGMETFFATLILYSPNFILFFHELRPIYFGLIMFYNAVTYWQIVRKFREYKNI